MDWKLQTVTLTKDFGTKTSTEQSWNTDSNRVVKENKTMTQEIWKISILYPKTSKGFYHHIKFWKSIMNRRCSLKKTVIKNFAIFTGLKHLCWSLFSNKNACLKACNFIKKTLQHRWFLDSTAKFLRTAILKNLCERLLLRVLPFMLVWTFSYMNK